MKNKVYLFCAVTPIEARALSGALAFEGARRYFSQIGEPLQAIRKEASGKPGFAKAGHFLTISHTEKLFVAAFGKVPLGIDVEKRLAPHDKAKKKFFTPSEAREDFYTVWTRKEAVSKIGGEGLSALGKIQTTPEKAIFGQNEFSLYGLESFLPKGYVGSLAVASEHEIEVVLFG